MTAPKLYNVLHALAKVSSSLHGAQVRGLAFTSLSDFIEGQLLLLEIKLSKKVK